jgi:DHA2 family multidrug resistance protein
MTGFSLDTTQETIVLVSIVQGVGLGLLFVPITTAAFLTLPGQYRNGGTAMLTLIRNIGSSVGISMVIANLTDKTIEMHARLTEYTTPFNDALQMPDVASRIDLHTDLGRALLNAIVTKQASMIAYINDYWLLMVLTFAMIPLIFIISKSKTKPSEKDLEEAAVME